MKLEQQQQAQHLYFQTDLNKTQIADALNISRRSLHYWISQNNWERLKSNGGHIPSCLAENCYHIMGHLSDSILNERRADHPVTMQEVNMLYKLTLTINKLKARSTTNETMETLAMLSDNIKKRAPKLAVELQPHINEYIATRAATNTGTFMPQRFNSSGYIPETKHNTGEEQLDQEDIKVWAGESSPGQPGANEPIQPVTTTPVATPPARSERVGERSHKIDIRKMLRGSATTGPGKILRQKSVAA